MPRPKKAALKRKAAMRARQAKAKKASEESAESTEPQSEDSSVLDTDNANAESSLDDTIGEENPDASGKMGTDSINSSDKGQGDAAQPGESIEEADTKDSESSIIKLKLAAESEPSIIKLKLSAESDSSIIKLKLADESEVTTVKKNTDSGSNEMPIEASENTENQNPVKVDENTGLQQQEDVSATNGGIDASVEASSVIKQTNDVQGMTQESGNEMNEESNVATGDVQIDASTNEKQQTDACTEESVESKLEKTVKVLNDQNDVISETAMVPENEEKQTDAGKEEGEELKPREAVKAASDQNNATSETAMEVSANEDKENDDYLKESAESKPEEAVKAASDQNKGQGDVAQPEESAEEAATKDHESSIIKLKLASESEPSSEVAMEIHVAESAEKESDDCMEESVESKPEETVQKPSDQKDVATNEVEMVASMIENDERKRSADDDIGDKQPAKRSKTEETATKEPLVNAVNIKTSRAGNETSLTSTIDTSEVNNGDKENKIKESSPPVPVVSSTGENAPQSNTPAGRCLKPPEWLLKIQPGACIRFNEFPPAAVVAYCIFRKIRMLFEQGAGRPLKTLVDDIVKEMEQNWDEIMAQDVGNKSYPKCGVETKEEKLRSYTHFEHAEGIRPPDWILKIPSGATLRFDKTPSAAVVAYCIFKNIDVLFRTGRSQPQKKAVFKIVMGLRKNFDLIMSEGHVSSKSKLRQGKEVSKEDAAKMKDVEKCPYKFTEIEDPVEKPVSDLKPPKWLLKVPSGRRIRFNKTPPPSVVAYCVLKSIRMFFREGIQKPSKHVVEEMKQDLDIDEEETQENEVLESPLEEIEYNGEVGDDNTDVKVEDYMHTDLGKPCPKHLKCRNCQELVEQPIILPCCHVLCKYKCANDILAEGKLNCPKCRENHFFPSGINLPVSQLFQQQAIEYRKQETALTSLTNDLDQEFDEPEEENEIYIPKFLLCSCCGEICMKPVFLPQCCHAVCYDKCIPSIRKGHYVPCPDKDCDLGYYFKFFEPAIAYRYHNLSVALQNRKKATQEKCGSVIVKIQDVVVDPDTLPENEYSVWPKKLICPKCRHLFVEPLALPKCSHAVCKTCIDGMYKEDKAVVCPLPGCTKDQGADCKGSKGLSPSMIASKVQAYSKANPADGPGRDSHVNVKASVPKPSQWLTALEPGCKVQFKTSPPAHDVGYLMYRSIPFIFSPGVRKPTEKFCKKFALEYAKLGPDGIEKLEEVLEMEKEDREEAISKDEKVKESKKEVHVGPAPVAPPSMPALPVKKKKTPESQEPPKKRARPDGPPYNRVLPEPVPPTQPVAPPSRALDLLSTLGILPPTRAPLPVPPPQDPLPPQPPGYAAPPRPPPQAPLPGPPQQGMPFARTLGYPATSRHPPPPPPHMAQLPPRSMAQPPPHPMGPHPPHPMGPPPPHPMGSYPPGPPGHIPGYGPPHLMGRYPYPHPNYRAPPAMGGYPPHPHPSGPYGYHASYPPSGYPPDPNALAQEEAKKSARAQEQKEYKEKLETWRQEYEEWFQKYGNQLAKSTTSQPAAAETKPQAAQAGEWKPAPTNSSDYRPTVSKGPRSYNDGVTPSSSKNQWQPEVPQHTHTSRIVEPAELIFKEMKIDMKEDGVPRLSIENLPEDIKSSNLKAILSKHGQVLSCKVGRDKRGMKAVVEFQTEADASRIKQQLNYSNVEGRNIEISHYKVPLPLEGDPQGFLWIGNLPKGTKAADLKAFVEVYAPVMQCKVGFNKKENMTFSMLAMQTKDDAVRSIKKIDKLAFNGMPLMAKRLRFAPK